MRMLQSQKLTNKKKLLVVVRDFVSSLYVELFNVSALSKLCNISQNYRHFDNLSSAYNNKLTV